MRFTWIAMYRFGIAVFAVTFFMFSGWAPGITGSAAQQEPPERQQKKEPLHFTVILEKVYVDGEISQEVVHETCWSMENFWAKYDQWQMVDMGETTFVFRRQV